MVSVVIWIVSLPLVAAQFHIVAPIALLMNPLVMLPVAAALVSGFFVLLTGGWLPPVAIVAGWICSLSIEVLQWMVDRAASVPMGHWWAVGPPVWSVGVFYAVVVIAFSLRPAGVRWQPALAAFGIWGMAGWWVPAQVDRYAATQRDSLVCTFVDVGHGTCILLELPGGRNLLYDCGSMGSGRRGASNACGVLWSRRISHLDAVVISHADTDHFNGLPLLARQFSIGRLWISESMAGRRGDPLTGRLLDSLEESGLNVATVRAGDRLDVGPDVRIEVLHPPAAGIGESDNSNSIVLEVAYRGRRVLLPGDLEGEGLDALLGSRPRPCDVLLAPHHGSAASRPRDMLAWADPRYVVIAGRRGRNEPPPLQSLPESIPAIFHTGRHGAIRAVIDVNGQLSVNAWRRQPW
jgi:competence protein ComEC